MKTVLMLGLGAIVGAGATLAVAVNIYLPQQAVACIPVVEDKGAWEGTGKPLPDFRNWMPPWSQ